MGKQGSAFGLIHLASGEQYNISDTVAVLGRAPENDVVCRDGLVSKQHAVIFHTDSGFYIQDLKSRNGTLINDRRLKPFYLYRIQPGDVITVGLTMLSFVNSAPRGISEHIPNLTQSAKLIESGQLQLVS